MAPDTVRWTDSIDDLDWDELTALYRAAPLGNKSPATLKTAFSNSMYRCLAYDQGRLVGAGRALADGVDCSYICDVAVHPAAQGTGIGKAIVAHLRDASHGHRKIILYSNPGKEDFYRKLGFRRMRTAMAIFRNLEQAVQGGLVDD